MQVRVRTIWVGLMILTSLTCSAQSGPPKLCKPCLFYAGDLDPNNANSDAFWNESTLIDQDTQTYGGITVPKNHILLIQGILFQTLFVIYEQLDPADVIPWEIRTGNISDNGGTLVASGSARLVMQPTGRLFFGGTEYTLAAKLAQGIELSGGQSNFGTQYWFNLLPQCSNPNNLSCLNAQYYVPNTPTEINGYRKHAQNVTPVINSPHRGYNWESLCELGFDGCFSISFGLIGKVVQ